MRLYLVQHGDAVDETVNPERPLSEEGIRDVEAVGKFLRRASVHVPEFWHSGKTRARQTAEHLARYCGEKGGLSAGNAAGGLVEKPGLKPNDAVGPLRKELKDRDKDLAIVGHLPFMAKLASLLLTGDEDAGIVVFEKGGVVCLERTTEGSWMVRWMVIPSLLVR